MGWFVRDLTSFLWVIGNSKYNSLGLESVLSDSVSFGIELSSASWTVFWCIFSSISGWVFYILGAYYCWISSFEDDYCEIWAQVLWCEKWTWIWMNSLSLNFSYKLYPWVPKPVFLNLILPLNCSSGAVRLFFNLGVIHWIGEFLCNWVITLAPF